MNPWKAVLLLSAIAMFAGLLHALWMAETWGKIAFGLGAIGISICAPMTIFTWMKGPSNEEVH